jgi:SAM-dependent methyltransferase
MAGVASRRLRVVRVERAELQWHGTSLAMPPRPVHSPWRTRTLAAVSREQWEAWWRETPAEEFGWFRSNPEPGIEEAIRDRAQLPAGAAIDVGSGIGHIAAHLGSAFTPSVALDIARPALVEGRTRFPGLPVGVVDARVLPLRDGCAALVVSRGCLHVFPAAEFPGYLGELARVLRPGGRLFLTARRRWHTSTSRKQQLRDLARIPGRLVAQHRDPRSRTLNSRRALARCFPPTLRVDRIEHRKLRADIGVGLPQVWVVATRVEPAVSGP